jgi:zinc protease
MRISLSFAGSGAVACLACAAITSAPASSPAQSASIVRPLEYTRSVLPNGLVVLLNEDHSSPVVAIDVWYHIGAKDELPGRTGLAHLCEHLMSEGSPNVSVPQRVFVQSIGGTSSRWANTTEDITHYYYTVPRYQLEPALWAESDRMAAPLSRADAGHLGPVREVIKQERLQSRENSVFGVADELTRAALFPGDHPYRNDPLGPTADLDAATPDEAKSFCAPYYVPNNAVISLSGDLSSANARTLIEKYFGGIPRGPTPSHRTMPLGGLSATTRLVLEDPRAETTTLRFAWPTVEFANADRLPLVALGWLLSRDRVGRLNKLLVYDRALASRVSAVNFDFEKGGLFQIDVSPRPGVSLTLIEQLVDSTLAAFDTQSISAQDLDSFKRSNAVLAVTQLQPRAARADTLAHGEVFAKDPIAYAKQVNKTLEITPADVQRVAKHYLSGARMVMSMVPAGQRALISKPELPYTNVSPRSSKAVP